MARAKDKRDEQDDSSEDTPKNAAQFDVWCDTCGKPVDSIDNVTEHKVYVSCHGMRQGVLKMPGRMHAFRTK